MSYEDSYAKAFPFDKMVDGMMNPVMIDDAVEIIMEGIRRRKRMNLIINNRAGGITRMIAQQIAKRLKEVINVIPPCLFPVTLCSDSILLDKDFT